MRHRGNDSHELRVEQITVSCRILDHTILTGVIHQRSQYTIYGYIHRYF